MLLASGIIVLLILPVLLFKLLAAHRGDFGGVEIHRWRFGGRPAD